MSSKDIENIIEVGVLSFLIATSFLLLNSQEEGIAIFGVLMLITALAKIAWINYQWKRRRDEKA